MPLVREYRHLFNGPRRIVATICADLSRLRFHPGVMSCFRCEWERQPSVALYPEFKVWMDNVLSDVVAQTGQGILYLFELPSDSQQAEAWLYEPGKEPRLADTLRNPCGKPLSELMGMPREEWEDA
jgi:hypothetical protein